MLFRSHEQSPSSSGQNQQTYVSPQTPGEAVLPALQRALTTAPGRRPLIPPPDPPYPALPEGEPMPHARRQSAKHSWSRLGRQEERTAYWYSLHRWPPIHRCMAVPKDTRLGVYWISSLRTSCPGCGYHIRRRDVIRRSTTFDIIHKTKVDKNGNLYTVPYTSYSLFRRQTGWMAT